MFNMLHSVRAIDGTDLTFARNRAIPIQECITMADVFVTVTFRDAGNNLATRRYLLAPTYSAAGTDFDQAVTDAAALITALDVLTMDHIDSHALELILPDGGAAANVAANNNVEAFIRTVTGATDKQSHISVPAWDDFTFAKAANGLLSAAFQTAANTAVALLRDPGTGELITSPWSQSRGMKRGQRLVK